MFCDRCGTPIQADFNVCPKCGRVLQAATRPDAHTRFARHLHLLGLLWIVAGAIWIIPSLAVVTIGHTVRFGGSPFGPAMFGPFMFGLGAGFLLVAAAGICVGWGLMQREHWARTAAIVLGVLVLLKPPFGTALGIFTLWVLLSQDAERQFEELSHR